MGGLMIRSFQGDNLKNAFCSNQNIVNLKVLLNFNGIYTSRLHPNQSIELWKGLHLSLTVMRLQRSYHVQFPSR